MPNNPEFFHGYQPSLPLYPATVCLPVYGFCWTHLLPSQEFSRPCSLAKGNSFKSHKRQIFWIHYASKNKADPGGREKWKVVGWKQMMQVWGQVIVVCTKHWWTKLMEIVCVACRDFVHSKFTDTFVVFHQQWSSACAYKRCHPAHFSTGNGGDHQSVCTWNESRFSEICAEASHFLLGEEQKSGISKIWKLKHVFPMFGYCSIFWSTTRAYQRQYVSRNFGVFGFLRQ